MADSRKPGKSAGTPPRLSPSKKSAAQRTPAAASHEQATVIKDYGLQLQGIRHHVNVRAYSAMEWLRLLPVVEPMVSTMAEAIKNGREPNYEEALASMAAQGDLTALLVADAADLTAATFRALCPDDCELLLMTWWGTNGRYLVQRAVNRLAVRRAEMARVLDHPKVQRAEAQHAEAA